MCTCTNRQSYTNTLTHQKLAHVSIHNLKHTHTHRICDEITYFPRSNTHSSFSISFVFILTFTITTVCCPNGKLKCDDMYSCCVSWTWIAGIWNVSKAFQIDTTKWQTKRWILHMARMKTTKFCIHCIKWKWNVWTIKPAIWINVHWTGNNAIMLQWNN